MIDGAFKEAMKAAEEAGYQKAIGEIIQTITFALRESINLGLGVAYVLDKVTARLKEMTEK